MKKILCASLLLGGLLGAGVANADPRVSGTVSFGDRHVNGTIFYNTAPVYYGHPVPVYYPRPVMAPVYHAPRYGHHHGHYRHHHHRHHHGHHHHRPHHKHHHGGHHHHRR